MVDDVEEKLFGIVCYFLHEKAVQNCYCQLAGCPFFAEIVVSVKPHHFEREYFDQSILVESDIFGGKGSMATPFDPNHLADSEDARAQYAPYFLFIEDFVFLVALLYFELESMIEVLIE